MICAVTFVVREYDEAIVFFRDVLDFEVVEDRPVPEQGKRWVTVRPCGGGTALVLGRATNERQRAAVGQQHGGRVGFFLATRNFVADYGKLIERGVVFRREPKREPYGMVAVFEDLYGGLWDLVEFVDGHSLAARTVADVDRSNRR